MACKITYKGKRYNNDAALQLDVLKDKNLLARYTELYNRLVDTAVLNIDEVEKFEDAKARLLDILPSNVFTITDKSQLADRVVNNGITFGYLDDKLIYLATNAPMGNAYHEAFHAVFRTFLNDSDIQKYLDLAKEKYGTVTDEQLNEFRQQSSAYNRLTKPQLENLWYEEKMSNDFSLYMRNKKPKTVLGKLFAKLKQIIDYFFNSSTSLETLFSNISLGQFKSATPVHNIYRTSPPAFNLIKSVGFDSLTASSIAQLQGKLYYGLAQSRKNSISNTAENKAIVSQSLRDGYNLSLWRNQLSDLSTDKRITVMRKIASMYNAVSLDNHYVLGDNLEDYVLVDNNEEQKELVSSNLDTIIRNTNNKIKSLEFDPDEEIEDDDDTTDSLKDMGGQYKGSYDRQAKAVKQLIETTPFYSDVFNTGITLDEINALPEQEKELYLTFTEGGFIFNTIRKQVTNLDKADILKTVLNIESKVITPFVNVVVNDILKDLSIEPYKIDGKIQYVDKTNLAKYAESRLFLQHLGKVSNTYNVFVQAFHSSRDLYVGLYIDSNNNPKQIILSNKDQAEQIAKKWASNSTLNKVTQEVFKEQLDRIISAFDSLESNLFTVSGLADIRLSTRINNIKTAFRNIGITIPTIMIETNIINNYINKAVRDNNITEEEAILEANNKIEKFTNPADRKILKRLLSLMAVKNTVTSQSRTTLTGSLNTSEEGILKRMSRFKAFSTELSPINAMLSSNLGDFVLLSLANEVLYYDDTATNLSIQGIDGNSIFSMNPSHFMSELMTTLKSNDMKIFIRALNNSKYVDAYRKFNDIFGKNSKYGYNKDLLDKLFIAYKNNPILSNNITKDPTELVTMMANNIVLYSTGRLSGEDKLGVAEEYHKLNAYNKIITKLGLYGRDMIEGVAANTRNFVLNILESKSIHRIFTAPINISNLRSNYYRAYKLSLKTEFDLIRSEVQKVNKLYDNKTTIASEVFLYEGYNYVRSKVNNNVYIPVFNENGAFIKFVNLRRNYSEEGDFISVTVVEDNGGLTEKDIPRAFKLFEFTDMNNAKELERVARGNVEFNDIPFINKSLEDFHKLKFSNFITQLQLINVVEKLDGVKIIKTC